MSKELWDIQAMFTDRVLKTIDKDIKYFTDEDRIRWTKEYLLSISKEGSEALDELNWKKHTKESKNINYNNVKIELIDIQKFLWGLMHIWNMTYEEFNELFKSKTYEVEKKWVQNFELKGVNENKRNCIIDIDGVLNYYPNCFYEWVYSNFGISKNQLLNNRLEYERMKDEYRSSGIKKSLKPNTDSINALNKLKESGYSIIIMTNRPYLQYKNMAFDTLYWLDIHKISYDYIYWSRDRKIVDAFNNVDSVCFIVDDSIDICNDFTNMGVKSYLFTEDDSLQYGNKIKSIFEIEELKCRAK